MKSVNKHLVVFFISDSYASNINYHNALLYMQGNNPWKIFLIKNYFVLFFLLVFQEMNYSLSKEERDHPSNGTLMLC